MTEQKDLKILNANNFNETIKDGISLVDFWADWCMPCRMQAPILEKVAESVGEKANICKLDVDEHGSVAAEYGISSIPSILLFNNGVLTKQFVGVQNEETLTNAINSLI